MTPEATTPTALGCTDPECDTFCDICIAEWHSEADRYSSPIETDRDPEPEVVTFATHRDDEYFESLMAASRQSSVEPEAVERWIAKAEATEAAARTKEIAELKFLWGLGGSDGLRYDGEKKSYRWWKPSDTSFLPDPEVIDERNVPAVVMFRGTTWNLPTYTYTPKNSFTPHELLASLLPKKIVSKPAGELYHGTVVTDTEDAVQLRDQMDADMLEWLHRDEDENEIVHRWNSETDADLSDEEKSAREEERAEWRTQQTAFLRAKLHRLLKEYFRKADYRNEQLVTKWEQIHGRWQITESTPILEWVSQRVTERGELSGYASLVRSVEYRIAKRRGRQGKNEAAWVKAA